MKTKFDALVKLKKLDVDKIERGIIKQNDKINKINQKIDFLQKELSEIEYPKSGNFAMITQIKVMQNAVIQEINSKKEELKFIQNQITLLKGQLKEKELEYEKMKYLQGEEIKKEIKRLKKEEAKNMDEIALMLFKGEDKL